MAFTGFALYGEGTQAGSWANRLFSSWLIPLMGQSQDVHTWHHLGMWGVVIFVVLHVYAAIREDIMGRQSMVSTMISGYRTSRTDLAGLAALSGTTRWRRFAMVFGRQDTRTLHARHRLRDVR